MQKFVLIIITILAITSCTRTVYEPVESVHTEYRDRIVERSVVDTINNTRLIYVKGDTVVDIRERERIRQVEIHDTIYTVICDTIAAPYPMERQLSRWERTKIDWGGYAFLALALLGVCGILYVRFRLTKI